MVQKLFALHAGGVPRVLYHCILLRSQGLLLALLHFHLWQYLQFFLPLEGNNHALSPIFLVVRFYSFRLTPEVNKGLAFGTEGSR